jgi:spore coat protein U-like protein
MLLCSRVDAASCTVSTTAVSFGVYDVFSATATDSTGTITFRCTGNASVTINLNKGTSATFTPRVLTSGSNTINYNLYTDAARGSIWGDTTGGTSNYSNANPANNQNIVVTVYGRITSGQDVSAGSYSDTITATINF